MQVRERLQFTMRLDIDKYVQYWDGHRAKLQTYEGGREAAVLIPLIQQDDGETAILFEVRSARLRTQPSEICFPGGGIEKDETPEETAVRETEEELLISAEQIKVFGQADGTIGPGGSPMWAYAGVLKDYHQTFSKDEVEEVFCVPLSWLLAHEPEMYSAKAHFIPGEGFPADTVPGGFMMGKKSLTMQIPVYRYGKYVIWGATARILKSFLDRVKEIL